MTADGTTVELIAGTPEKSWESSTIHQHFQSIKGGLRQTSSNWFETYDNILGMSSHKARITPNISQLYIYNIYRFWIFDARTIRCYQIHIISPISTNHYQSLTWRRSRQVYAGGYQSWRSDWKAAWLPLADCDFSWGWVPLNYIERDTA